MLQAACWFLPSLWLAAVITLVLVFLHPNEVCSFTCQSHSYRWQPLLRESSFALIIHKERNVIIEWILTHVQIATQHDFTSLFRHLVLGVPIFEPVGCYLDSGTSPRPMPLLLKDFRPEMNWNNIEAVIKQCASLAYNRSLRLFLDLLLLLHTSRCT